MEYETRFEGEYGYFRPVMQEVVERYLDCGNPMCGFARIRCLEIKGNCERFVASIKSKFLYFIRELGEETKNNKKTSQ